MTHNLVLWIRAAAIRVLRVGAAAAVATIGAQSVFTEIAWDVVGAAAVLAMIIEGLVCVASLPEAEFPTTLFTTHHDDDTESGDPDEQDPSGTGPGRRDPGGDPGDGSV